MTNDWGSIIVIRRLSQSVISKCLRSIVIRKKLCVVINPDSRLERLQHSVGQFPFILPVQPSSTTMIFYCQIIDFGLARVREISERTQRYQPCAGTVSFTAPEVFEAKVEKGKGKKVDVYS